MEWGNYAGGRTRYERGLKDARMAGAFDRTEHRRQLYESLYNLACIYTMLSTGKKGPKIVVPHEFPETPETLRRLAVERLRELMEFAPECLGQVQKDPDLDPIRNTAEFNALLKEWEEKGK